MQCGERARQATRGEATHASIRPNTTPGPQ